MKKLFVILLTLGLGAGAFWHFSWNQPCSRLTRSICSGDTKLCRNIKDLVRENLSQEQCQQFLDGKKGVEELIKETSRIPDVVKDLLKD